jgi:hypothetical protein
MKRVSSSFGRFLMRHAQPFIPLLVSWIAISPAVPITTNATETSQPQIVRVTYVQGEVKLSTGIKGRPDLGKNWIAAGVDLPIEEGATLATENGRAEVEFENGTMAYLAEHSVLQFEGLTGDSQGTSTEVTLLTGRATFVIESNGHDEFTVNAAAAAILHTLAHNTQPTNAFRVESALDGAVVQVLEGFLQIAEGVPPKTVKLGPGEAVQCVDEMLSRVQGLPDDADQKAWDQWVSEERTARKADIEKGLKESGLAAPIPGLVELVRGGTFSDCPPYGKCWEPREASEVLQEQGQAKASPEPRAKDGGVQTSSIPSPAQSAAVQYKWIREYEGTHYQYADPCSWGPVGQRRHWVDKLLKITPDHPEGVVVQTLHGADYADGSAGSSFGYYSGWGSYSWPTCYGGSWVPRPHSCKVGTRCESRKHRHHKMRWVVAPKSKGGSFVRVRMGKKVGFIPKHPLDGKGKPPLNAKDGVLVFHGKNGQGVAKIIAAPKDLKIVDDRLPGHEANWAKNLPKVEKPVIEGRLIKGGPSSEGLKAAQDASRERQTSIRYDYKAGDFAVFAKGAEAGRGNGRPVVFEHLGVTQGHGSGSSAGRSSGGSGGGSGGGAGHSGNSGGGHSGGSGGSSGGGHGGGGGGGYSGGGGGGSHGSSGGGGGSSSSSSGGGGGSSSGSSGGGRR